MMTRTLILVFGLAVASQACVASGQATMGVDTTPVVYQNPPPARVETYGTRPGFLYVKGRWNWQNGQWVWADGHWERERAGYAWNDGRWEQRGNRWEWIEGTWAVSSGPPPITAQGGVTVSSEPPPREGPVAQGGVTVSSEYPTAAPPPLRAENQASRAGFVWVSGRWDWKAGNWAWVDGHWERERANEAWVAGRWEMQGNRWIWVEGRWEKHAAGPVVRDHR
jgi:hypothetical protein